MFAGNAFAVLYELPTSSFQGGAWNGESTYTDNGFQVLLQYAVYDTLSGNEWVNDGGYEAPGDGRYIYAYQVFNANSDTQDIGYLKLFGAEGSALTGGEISGLGSQKDPTDDQFPEQGKKPFSGEFDDTNKEIVLSFDKLFFELFGHNGKITFRDRPERKRMDSAAPCAPGRPGNPHTS